MDGADVLGKFSEQTDMESLREALSSLVGVYEELYAARTALENKEWKRASERADSALEHEDDWTDGLKLQIYEVRGRARARQAGQAEAAVADLRMAIWCARRKKLESQVPELLIALGDALQRCGATRWAEAQLPYHEAERLFECEAHRTDRAAECKRKRATVELYFGRPRQALELCLESKVVFEAYGEAGVRGVWKALQHMTWAYDMLGRWREAVNVAERADQMVMFHAPLDMIERAKSKRYLGDAYRINRQYDEAERAYNQGLALVGGLPPEDTEVTQVRAMCLLGRTKVHVKHRGREMDAWEDLEASMTMHRELKSDFRYAEVLTEQGELYLKLKAFDDALTSLWQAAELFARFPNHFCHANALAELAALFYETGEADQLLAMLEQTRAIASHSDDDDNADLLNYQLSRILYLVGRQHADAGKPEEAIPFLIEALERAQKFNWKTFKEVASRIEDGVEHALDPTTRIVICEQLVSFWRSSFHTGFAEEQRAYIEHWCDRMERVVGRASALES